MKRELQKLEGERAQYDNDKTTLKGLGYLVNSQCSTAS